MMKNGIIVLLMAGIPYRQWLLVLCMACLPLMLVTKVLAEEATTGSVPASAWHFPSSEPEFEALHEKAMIDNQVVTALAQDKRGLIWIGTQNGLVRYDGYRFRRFMNKADDPSSLAADFVTALMVADDGRLWVGSSGSGVSVFDPRTERFEHFQHDPKQAGSITGGMVWAFAADDKNGIWIGTDEGLNYLPDANRANRGNRQFVRYRHSNDARSLGDNRVRSLLYDRTGRLWVGSFNALQRLNLDGRGFETILVGKNVRTLFQAADGKLWLATREHGAAWLMPDADFKTSSQDAPEATLGAVSRHVNWLPLAQLSRPWVSGIAQANAQHIWLATFGGGIMVVSANDGQVLQTLRHDSALPGSLALDEIGSLLRDRAGWMWVGTWGAGLQRMNTNNDMVQLLRHSPQRKNGLSAAGVLSILELNDGRLLFGSDGNGIDIFDRHRGLIDGYRHLPDQPGSLPDKIVVTMAQTADGCIWAGTRQAGAVRRFPGSGEWVSVPGLPDKQVTKLLPTGDGGLWAGTGIGVARWVPANAQVQGAGTAATAKSGIGESPGHFEVVTDEQGKPLQTLINIMAEDKQGRVWIGTNNGLWVHIPGSNGLIRIPADPSRADGLASGMVYSLLADHHGHVWIITDKGLQRLKTIENKLARFEPVSAREGLFEKPLGGNLQKDRQGRIWTEAVVLAPGSPESIMRSQSRNTLAGIDIGTKLGSMGHTRDGLLLFGGTTGVAIIDPARFTPYIYAPPLIVTELKINGETVAPQTLANTDLPVAANTAPDRAPQLVLSPQQRNFSIEFAALDFSDPQLNQYQYRLQGYDNGWINADADHRVAAYGNLWPGQYTLQVRGSNRLGVWSSHVLTIPIRVLPAWWQTGWFALVLLLLAASLMFALVRTRTRILRRRQRELEQLVDERTGQLRQKQQELVQANDELNHANDALNESNQALNQSNEALNVANADLSLSVETLRRLSEIGREITANLETDIVFQALRLYVSGLLDAPAMTIFRMNAAATALETVFECEDDKILPKRHIPLDSPTSMAARAARERQELLLHFDSGDSGSHLSGTRYMLTALFAPLIVDEQILGVMSIQSDQQHAYGERERLIFRTLCAYGAIALANSAALDALRQAQAQLVQQEKMASLGGLVAGIAHEINTPLGTALTAISGVDGAWQTLQGAVNDGKLSKSVLHACTAKGIEYTELAHKTTSRAAELIALFKSIAVNADSDCPMRVELADYLQEISTLVHRQLLQNGCRLEVSAPAGLSIHIVPEALTEALSRILVNVLDHAFVEGRSGTLHIGAQADAEEVVITIGDDGHGIAPEHLPKVFDPFFTTKSGAHGHVGLGLHVAYNQITQRLGGQIRIRSVLGGGTDVEIRLKRNGHPPAPPATYRGAG